MVLKVKGRSIIVVFNTAVPAYHILLYATPEESPITESERKNAETYVLAYMTREGYMDKTDGDRELELQRFLEEKKRLVDLYDAIFGPPIEPQDDE